MMYIFFILILFCSGGIYASNSDKDVPTIERFSQSSDSLLDIEEEDCDDVDMMESFCDQAEVKSDSEWLKLLKNTGAQLYIKVFMLKLMFEKKVDHAFQWIKS